jgi:hypothetical protein
MNLDGKTRVLVLDSEQFLIKPGRDLTESKEASF